MRISDWSSDVCASDLTRTGSGSPSAAPAICEPSPKPAPNSFGMLPLLGRGRSKPFYDGAIRAIVAVAFFGKVEQGCPHSLQRLRLPMQFLGAGEGERLHLGAGALLVRPEREKPPDLLDRKAEVAGVGDKAEAGDVGRRIVAIARVAARGRGGEAGLTLVAIGRAHV